MAAAYGGEEGGGGEGVDANGFIGGAGCKDGRRRVRGCEPGADCGGGKRGEGCEEVEAVFTRMCGSGHSGEEGNGILLRKRIHVYDRKWWDVIWSVVRPNCSSHVELFARYKTSSILSGFLS